MGKSISDRKVESPHVAMSSLYGEPAGSVLMNIDFNGPLNALSVSPGNNLVVVGGRDVLKVVEISTAGFVEKRNLRAGRVNLSFNANDVAWHPDASYQHLVATASTNGMVVIWNLQREAVRELQECVMKEHKRAVNRICWHPNDANLLMSGSQDGTVKLWDMRKKSCVLNIKPRSESVRDVQFSPFRSSWFAAGFENGTAQVWDLRQPSTASVKLSGHKGLVLSLDWHWQNPFLLATGSRDRTINVWNVEGGSNRQPLHTVQTIASVYRVLWRKNHPTQLANTSSIMDNGVSLWDLCGSGIPVARLMGHDEVATGLAWLPFIPPASESSFSSSSLSSTSFLPSSATSSFFPASSSSSHASSASSPYPSFAAAAAAGHNSALPAAALSPRSAATARLLLPPPAPTLASAAANPSLGPATAAASQTSSHTSSYTSSYLSSHPSSFMSSPASANHSENVSDATATSVHSLSPTEFVYSSLSQGPGSPLGSARRFKGPAEQEYLLPRSPSPASLISLFSRDHIGQVLSADSDVVAYASSGSGHEPAQGSSAARSALAQSLQPLSGSSVYSTGAAGVAPSASVYASTLSSPLTSASPLVGAMGVGLTPPVSPSSAASSSSSSLFHRPHNYLAPSPTAFHSPSGFHANAQRESYGSHQLGAAGEAFSFSGASPTPTSSRASSGDSRGLPCLLLLSCSKDCSLKLHALPLSHQPARQINTTPLAFSATTGEVAFALKPIRRSSIFPVVVQEDRLVFADGSEKRVCRVLDEQAMAEDEAQRQRDEVQREQEKERAREEKEGADEEKRIEQGKDRREQGERETQELQPSRARPTAKGEILPREDGRQGGEMLRKTETSSNNAVVGSRGVLGPSFSTSTKTTLSSPSSKAGTDLSSRVGGKEHRGGSISGNSQSLRASTLAFHSRRLSLVSPALSDLFAGEGNSLPHSSDPEHKDTQANHTQKAETEAEADIQKRIERGAETDEYGRTCKINVYDLATLVGEDEIDTKEAISIVSAGILLQDVDDGHSDADAPEDGEEETRERREFRKLVATDSDRSSDTDEEDLLSDKDIEEDQHSFKDESAARLGVWASAETPSPWQNMSPSYYGPGIRPVYHHHSQQLVQLHQQQQVQEQQRGEYDEGLKAQYKNAHIHRRNEGPPSRGFSDVVNDEDTEHYIYFDDEEEDEDDDDDESMLYLDKSIEGGEFGVWEKYGGDACPELQLEDKEITQFVTLAKTYLMGNIRSVVRMRVDKAAAFSQSCDTDTHTNDDASFNSSMNKNSNSGRHFGLNNTNISSRSDLNKQGQGSINSSSRSNKNSSSTSSSSSSSSSLSCFTSPPAGFVTESDFLRICAHNARAARAAGAAETGQMWEMLRVLCDPGGAMAGQAGSLSCFPFFLGPGGAEALAAAETDGDKGRRGSARADSSGAQGLAEGGKGGRGGEQGLLGGIPHAEAGRFGAGEPEGEEDLLFAQLSSPGMLVRQLNLANPLVAELEDDEDEDDEEEDENDEEEEEEDEEDDEKEDEQGHRGVESVEGERGDLSIERNEETDEDGRTEDSDDSPQSDRCRRQSRSESEEEYTEEDSADERAGNRGYRQKVEEEDGGEGEGQQKQRSRRKGKAKASVATRGKERTTTSTTTTTRRSKKNAYRNKRGGHPTRSSTEVTRRRRLSEHGEAALRKIPPRTSTATAASTKSRGAHNAVRDSDARGVAREPFCLDVGSENSSESSRGRRGKPNRSRTPKENPGADWRGRGGGGGRDEEGGRGQGGDERQARKARGEGGGVLGRMRVRLVHDSLTYLVDRGEVQTAAALALALGPEAVGEARLQQLLANYLDLLLQRRLFLQAAEVIRDSPDAQIRQMNMQSTTFHTNCARCKKPMEPPPPLAEMNAGGAEEEQGRGERRDGAAGTEGARGGGAGGREEGGGGGGGGKAAGGGAGGEQGGLAESSTGAASDQKPWRPSSERRSSQSRGVAIPADGAASLSSGGAVSASTTAEVSEQRPQSASELTLPSSARSDRSDKGAAARPASASSYSAQAGILLLKESSEHTTTKARGSLVAKGRRLSSSSSAPALPTSSLASDLSSFPSSSSPSSTPTTSSSSTSYPSSSSSPSSGRPFESSSAATLSLPSDGRASPSVAQGGLKSLKSGSPTRPTARSGATFASAGGRPPTPSQPASFSPAAAAAAGAGTGADVSETPRSATSPHPGASTWPVSSSLLSSGGASAALPLPPPRSLCSSAAAICTHCRRTVALCGLCQLPVTGLFVWCPHCSHGGHLSCLQEWFITERWCPSGCGHDCGSGIE